MAERFLSWSPKMFWKILRGYYIDPRGKCMTKYRLLNRTNNCALLAEGIFFIHCRFIWFAVAKHIITYSFLALLLNPEVSLTGIEIKLFVQSIFINSSHWIRICAPNFTQWIRLKQSRQPDIQGHGEDSGGHNRPTYKLYTFWYLNSSFSKDRRRPILWLNGAEDPPLLRAEPPQGTILNPTTPRVNRIRNWSELGDSSRRWSDHVNGGFHHSFHLFVGAESFDKGVGWTINRNTLKEAAGLWLRGGSIKPREEMWFFGSMRNLNICPLEAHLAGLNWLLLYP